MKKCQGKKRKIKYQMVPKVYFRINDIAIGHDCVNGTLNVSLSKNDQINLSKVKKKVIPD